MTPMTPEQRSEAAFYLPPGQNPAAPELVADAARKTRAWGICGDTLTDRQRHAIADGVRAVIRRLLDAERDIEALRRALAEVVAIADDNPDVGLTGAEVTHLATARGIDLRADIEHAETLREAEQLAGAR